MLLNGNDEVITDLSLYFLIIRAILDTLQADQNAFPPQIGRTPDYPLPARAHKAQHPDLPQGSGALLSGLLP